MCPAIYTEVDVKHKQKYSPEAFNVNLEDLVTKDYLAARLSELKADIDAKFRMQFVMISILLAAAVIPLLQDLTM